MNNTNPLAYLDLVLAGGLDQVLLAASEWLLTACILLGALKLARVRPSVARLAATFAVALVVSAVGLLSRLPHQVLVSIDVPSPSGQAVLGFVGLAVLIALVVTAAFGDRQWRLPRVFAAVSLVGLASITLALHLVFVEWRLYQTAATKASRLETVAVAMARGDLSATGCRTLGYRCLTAATPQALPSTLPAPVREELASVHRQISQYPSSQHSDFSLTVALSDLTTASYAYGYVWGGQRAYGAVDTETLSRAATVTRYQVTLLVIGAGLVWVVGLAPLELPRFSGRSHTWERYRSRFGPSANTTHGRHPRRSGECRIRLLLCGLRPVEGARSAPRGRQPFARRTAARSGPLRRGLGLSEPR